MVNRKLSVIILAIIYTLINVSSVLAIAPRFGMDQFNTRKVKVL